jgi:UDP-glucose 4-epimerase
VRNRIGSPERAKAEIGFEARIDLAEGLRRLIAWRAGHKSELESRRVRMFA